MGETCSQRGDPEYRATPARLVFRVRAFGANAWRKFQVNPRAYDE
jgi:hypothetical protein